MDEAGVWTELGHAQLEAGAINDAIGSYLRSGDSSRYTDVIARSQEANAHGDLVKYLLMVRKKVKESKVGQKSSPAMTAIQSRIVTLIASDMMARLKSGSASNAS